MILRAGDRSKAQVISSDDEQPSWYVYAEHLPALKLRSYMALPCTGGVDVAISRWHLCFCVKVDGYVVYKYIGCLYCSEWCFQVTIVLQLLKKQEVLLVHVYSLTCDWLYGWM